MRLTHTRAAYRRSSLIGRTGPACSHALPGACLTWPRALATAAPMRDAAISGAGAPVPAARSNWPPPTSAFAHVTVALATVMRDPFALADALLLATRTWKPSSLTAQAARTGSRAFLSFLEITLGLQPSMRYHGARTCPAAYRSSVDVRSPVPRFGGSAGLVSPHDASHDVPSIFGKRSERQARVPRDHVSAERRPVSHLQLSGLGRMPDRIEESTPSDQVARYREAQ